MQDHIVAIIHRLDGRDADKLPQITARRLINLHGKETVEEAEDLGLISVHPGCRELVVSLTDLAEDYLDPNRREWEAACQS